MAKAKENKGTVIYKPDENKLVLSGTLSAFRFGVNKFDKETEKYYVSIKADEIPAEIRDAIRTTFFADAKEKYIPDPFKENADLNNTYINLKSQYQIPVFVEGKGNKKYSYDEVIELGDGLPPYGSEVLLSCRLKEGAIYPLAIKFITVVKTSADDFFA